MKRFITSTIVWTSLLWPTQTALAQNTPSDESIIIEEKCDDLQELSKTECRRILECWWDVKINRYIKPDGGISQMEKFIDLNSDVKACALNKKREEIRKERRENKRPERWNPYKKESPKTMYT